MQVLFAREMKTTITSIKSRETRQHLLNKMLNLANGKRSPYLKPTDLASARYKKLIQVEPVIDYFLVWTVDVENGTQIIKVWNAVQISELSTLVRRLEGGFSMCTDNYIDRCTTRKQVDQCKKNLVVPAKWSSAHSIAKYKSLEETMHKPVSGVEGVVDDTELALEKSDVDDSVLLMKFYSLSSGIAHQLLTASDGSQLSLPFEVNEQEAAIIQYPRSSFIIGRSGTGKTTVITTKLLQREQEFWIASNGIASLGDEGEEEVGKEEGALNPEATGFLKQALVTLSPKLCAAVKHNISKTRRYAPLDETLLSRLSITKKGHITLYSVHWVDVIPIFHFEQLGYQEWNFLYCSKDLHLYWIRPVLMLLHSQHPLTSRHKPLKVLSGNIVVFKDNHLLITKACPLCIYTKILHIVLYIKIFTVSMSHV